MLVMLLPTPHRDTLHALLELCARVVTFQATNKMSLYNVAMIVAPNIFLPPSPRHKLNLRSEDKEQQLNHEVSHSDLYCHAFGHLVAFNSTFVFFSCC